jgi:two-component system chemotaxis response regulator CheY
MANIMVADDSDAIRLVLRDILAIGKHSVVAEAVNGSFKRYFGYWKT